MVLDGRWDCCAAVETIGGGRRGGREEEAKAVGQARGARSEAEHDFFFFFGNTKGK